MLLLIIIVIVTAYVLLWFVNQQRAKRRAELRAMEAAEDFETAVKHGFGQY